MDKVRRRVAKVARDAGKIASTVATPEKLKELADMGYNFPNGGGGVSALAAASNMIMDAFARL